MLTVGALYLVMLGCFPVFLGYTFLFVCLIWFFTSKPTTFQLSQDGSSWVEPVLSKDKWVLLKDHNAVRPVRLKPAVTWFRVMHSTTEPLCALPHGLNNYLVEDNMSCPRTLCSASGESGTSYPSTSSLTHYQLSHLAPKATGRCRVKGLSSLIPC